MADDLNGPDFLIVGAMKSATTSLAFDLESSGHIHFPAGKEVDLLASDDFDSELILIEEYLAKLGPDTGRLIGDASPLYMMREGDVVASRAKAYLKDSLVIVCILRDPILRAISHYKHVWQWSQSAFDSIDDAFSDPLFIETSLYGARLAPWIAHFGRERILVVRFEDFIRHRRAELSRVFKFLGVPDESNNLAADVALNTSEERYLLNKPAAIMRTSLRKLGLRGPLPQPVKRLILPFLSAEAPKLEAVPTMATLTRLREIFVADIEQLQNVLGDTSMNWDLDATIDRLQQ